MSLVARERRMRRAVWAGRACLAGATLMLCTVSVAGQSPAPPPPAPSPPASLPTFGGPPAPVAPEVVARDEAGRVTLRAVRIASPIHLDGHLDDEPYSAVSSIADFIQMEPQEGAPATQKTEFWLLFDRDNVYVTARCWEDHPERMVANEMRHDTIGIFQGNDNVTFILDTNYDRRNGLVFTVNPIGGRAEGQVTNERQYNGDLNVIWDVAVGRFEGGWTMEAAIPFKSLRYRPGTAQVWGFNIKRENRWKNETAFLTRMPNSLAQRAMMQLSLAATVVGLEAPDGLKNLEIKPYAVSSVTSDRTVTPKIANDLSGDVGLDVKYGLTRNLTADLTYNTDFAQVEADEQQINLTRFSLFFPEKREFFLENKGTFDFAGLTGGTGDAPTLFYSRRIGLHLGQSVPIVGGGRVTGRVGRYSVGVLDIQSGDDDLSGAPRTNFAVARLKRDILRRSSIGALMTRRSARERGPGANDAYGVDGTFAFFDNLSINTYWARTHTTGLSGDDTSYRAQLDYAGDRYGVQLEQMAIGEDFNPEVGFLRRPDLRKTFELFRASRRPRSIKSVRRFSATESINYLENGAGRRESRDWDAQFDVEFQNSDKATVFYNGIYEFLPQPFRIAPGVTIPVGGYDFGFLRGAYTFGPQRRMSGTVSVEGGTFYSGDRTTVALSAGRVELTPRFSLQPTVSVNRVALPEGSFTSNLVGSRVTYTMTPLMFVSALLQYNSSNNSLSSNVRLRWEYRPGSELFVVYNEQRNTLARTFPDLVNRALIVKINRLFRL